MKNVTLVERYAKAYYASAKQTNTVSVSFENLKAASQLLAQKEAALYFKNPTIPVETKIETVKKAFAGYEQQGIFSLILVLVQNGRFAILPALVERFQDFIDAEAGVIRGLCKVSVGFDSAAQEVFEQKLKTYFGKTVLMDYQTDESVLGGAVATVGGVTFDDSLRTHLSNLNEFLNKGAN